MDYYSASLVIPDISGGCGYYRAVAGGCLGEYTRGAGCDPALPATITVS